MAASQVVTAPGFSIPGTNTMPLVSDPFDLYTTPGGFPVLIESVHLTCNYGGGAPAGDMWILRYKDAAGHVLWAQATPAFSDNDIPGNMEVTWSRGASEQSYLPIVDGNFQGHGNFTGIATVPLPDLILDAYSVLTLQIIQNIYGGGSSAFDVVAPVITFDAGGATAGTSADDTFPLLLPLADS